jgi:hypothetical protein
MGAELNDALCEKLANPDGQEHRSRTGVITIQASVWRGQRNDTITPKNHSSNAVGRVSEML